MWAAIAGREPHAAGVHEHGGYRLNTEKITIRQGHEGGHCQMSPVTNVPPHVTGDIAEGEIGRGQGHSGDIFNERQTWFIDELKAGRFPQRTDIEEKFGCSDRTAKRDLIALRNYGTIEFVALSHPGHYRLKATQLTPHPAPT
ncbi:MAG: hypothetical protein FWD61_03240 [Phycisphaerales bacterium]|nr:hypothetical protein [Phycisphaerales bacterium]